MKNRILSILLLFYINGYCQSVPNSDSFCLSTVLSITGGSCLSQAFANSVDSYFDPAYKGSKDRLSNFRNYHPGTLYYSAAIDGYYSRNNCPEGWTPSSVYVSAPYGTYTSYTSQPAADVMAQMWAQDYANAEGTCTEPPPCTRPGGLSNYEFVWDIDPSWHPEGQMYGNSGDYVYSGTSGTDCSTLPDGFYHVGGNPGYVSEYHWYWDSTPCTTRPTGLTTCTFWYTMAGTYVNASNVCPLRGSATSEGMSAQSNLGEGDDVYFNQFSTDCSKISDGYYVLEVGGSKYAVQVIDGILHYVNCSIFV